MSRNETEKRRGNVTPAVTRLSLTSVLSSLAIALVLAAPCAFAKKDLFANDPTAAHAPKAASLVAATSAPAEAKHEEPAATKEAEVTPAPETEKKASYLESQLTRLKGHLVEAKDDLFGSKKTAKKIAPDTQTQTEQTLADSSHTTEDVPPQPELPTISAAEAAQRAQTFAEGQVINVRLYQESGQEQDKPRYAVKLLQKNGRMKTINLDAVSGEAIEAIETTEATPQ